MALTPLRKGVMTACTVLPSHVVPNSPETIAVTTASTTARLKIALTRADNCFFKINHLNSCTPNLRRIVASVHTGSPITL